MYLVWYMVPLKEMGGRLFMHFMISFIELDEYIYNINVIKRNADESDSGRKNTFVFYVEARKISSLK